MVKVGKCVAGAVLVLGAVSTCAQASYIDWTYWARPAPHKYLEKGRVRAPADAGVSVRYKGVADELRLDWGRAASGLDDLVNPPSANDGVLGLKGDRRAVDTISFGHAVTDPVIAIWNLGTPQHRAALDFLGNVRMKIIAYGNRPGDSIHLTGDGVAGRRGDGVIELLGTFRSISWFDTYSKDFYEMSVGVMKPSRVAEPATLGLLGAALAGLVGARWRRKAKAD